MVKFQKFEFDNFVLGEDNQPYVEDWENSHIEVEEGGEEKKEETSLPEPIMLEKPEEDIPEEKIEAAAEPEVAEEIIRYTEEEVAEKEEKARETGYAEGYRQAKAEGEEEHNRLLAALNDRLMMLSAEMSSRSETMENEIISLSSMIIRKVIPSIEAQEAQNLVTDFLEKNFPQFKQEGKLAFYFHPQALSYIQGEIARLANINDYEGKISLHKDEEMQVSDCRVEWEHGGVERNGKKMLDKIEKIFEANTSKE